MVCRQGTLRRGTAPDRERRDVEKEFALLFMVFDENLTFFVDFGQNHNLREPTGSMGSMTTDNER